MVAIFTAYVSVSVQCARCFLGHTEHNCMSLLALVSPSWIVSIMISADPFTVSNGAYCSFHKSVKFLRSVRNRFY